MSRDSKHVGTRDCLAIRESNERTNGPARGEGSVSSGPQSGDDDEPSDDARVGGFDGTTTTSGLVVGNVVVVGNAASEMDASGGGDAKRTRTTRGKDGRGRRGRGRRPRTAGDADRTARTATEGGAPRRRGWGSETSRGAE